MEVAGVDFEKLERINGEYIIGIRTSKRPNYDRYSEYFPERWNVRSYISEINFSNPLIDFKGNENNKLSLKAVWSDPESPLWNMWLSGEKGYVLGNEKRFGELDEPFRSYSEKRLIDWQKQAFLMHRNALLRLEDLFYEDKEIKENFLFLF